MREVERAENSTPTMTTTTATTTASATNCTTRMDCSANEVCFSLEAEGANVCKACAAFGNITCPFPCGIKDLKCSAHTLTMIAKLDLGPPYYFQWLTSVTKPICTAVAFGESPYTPIQSGWAAGVKSIGKMGVQAAFLGMFLRTFWDDLLEAWAAFHAYDDWVLGFSAAALVFETSSNVASGLSAFGLWVASVITQKFVEARAHVLGQALPQTTTPLLKMFYIRLVGAFYCIFLLLVGIFHIIYGLPYIWLGFLLFGIQLVIGHELKDQALKWGKREGFEELVTGSDAAEVSVEQKREILVASDIAKYRDASDSEVEAGFVAEQRVLAQTGMIEEGWRQYYLSSLWSPLITFGGPLAARFFEHREYWASITDTLSERHLATYVVVTISGMSPFLIFLWWIV